MVCSRENFTYVRGLSLAVSGPLADLELTHDENQGLSVRQCLLLSLYVTWIKRTLRCCHFCVTIRLSKVLIPLISTNFVTAKRT